MQILQLSTALPKNEHSTEKLIASFPCELPDGIKQNVLNLGVTKRHLIKRPDANLKTKTVMDETSLVNLCSEACTGALEKASLSSKDVGYLIAAYDVSPFLSPGLSQLLIPELGFDPYVKHVNVQGTASTAFMKTLELAEDHLARHPGDHVLICVSGVSSYWFQNQVQGMSSVMEIGQINEIEDKTKRRLELQKWVATMQYFLFGDGVASAVVAEGQNGLSVEKIVEVTNIEKKDYMAGYARLAVSGEPFKFGFRSHLDKEIPKLGVRYTKLALKRLFGEDAEKKMQAVKKWAVHTGSRKILDALAERNEIPSEKIKESHQILKDYGNLAGASLPFILEGIASQTRLSAGDIVVMLGYGWGFSASASTLEFKS